jgi:hypothetical protein
MQEFIGSPLGIILVIGAFILFLKFIFSGTFRKFLYRQMDWTDRVIPVPKSEEEKKELAEDLGKFFEAVVDFNEKTNALHDALKEDDSEKEPKKDSLQERMDEWKKKNR